MEGFMKLCIDCKYLSLPSNDENSASDHGICMHPNSVITNPVNGSMRKMLAKDARQCVFSGCGLEARFYVPLHDNGDDGWLDKVFHKAVHV